MELEAQLAINMRWPASVRMGKETLEMIGRWCAMAEDIGVGESSTGIVIPRFSCKVLPRGGTWGHRPLWNLLSRIVDADAQFSITWKCLEGIQMIHTLAGRWSWEFICQNSLAAHYLNLGGILSVLCQFELVLGMGTTNRIKSTLVALGSTSCNAGVTDTWQGIIICDHH